ESAVKKYALVHALPVLQPTNLKDPGFCKELQNFEAELFVVVAFRMLPEIVWRIPSLGTINLHASLLPDYRGAAPINWAIINGETVSGATTFFINEKIDTGDVLLQERVSIAPTDNVGDLHDKLMTEGAQLLLKTVKGLKEGRLKATPQPMNMNAKEAPKLTKENTSIDFSLQARQVYDRIRGLSPYPAAYTTLHQGDQSLNCKILNCIVYENDIAGKPGSIETDNRSYLLIKCGKGSLSLKELQLEGKKRMFIKDFLNGFSFSENASFS
ncbi:MAG: methionyl-tRNA formyltransferase, partial [Owenweeksia sp.]